ncbi:MAG TPA: hypothetical protein DCR15_11210 [Arthrobacter bacterium]|nr:hypothetical protein [Arthrobacter sp.]HBH57191.1 hypothetical protein [Arthrobacter sp.]
MTSNASTLIQTVDEMLLEAGQSDAAGLRAALLALGSFASLPVPEPGPELASLLSGQTHLLARHRLLRKHRATVVGLAVIAGMGLGVTGVAATGTAPGVQASRSIQHLLHDWAPAWTITGTPSANGSRDDLPDSQPPAEPGSPDASLPAQPATVGPDTAVPEHAGQNRSSEPAVRGNATSPGTSMADDGGASGNAADAAIRESHDPAKAGADAAAELDKAGKPVTGTLADAAATGETLTSAIIAPVPTEKTGTGNAGPGSIWLKKFSR